MVVPMEQWAGQPFQDESADLWVVMLSDHNEKYSDRMERSYKAFAVTFELRFPFPLSREWRCSWSSADRRCSNYIWVIDNFIAHWGASYIRDLTVHWKIIFERKLCILYIREILRPLRCKFFFFKRSGLKPLPDPMPASEVHHQNKTHWSANR